MRFALCALRYSFFLTFSLKLIELELRLGDRPVAGRRVLVPLTEVRILVPQPFFFAGLPYPQYQNFRKCWP